MKRGLAWYKRDPRAFLDGVRAARLTAREGAVYGVVLDLIYMGGGETPNDPKFIAGHFSDMGAAAVRGCLDRLVGMGKLDIEGEFLTNKRAKSEVETQSKRAETNAVSGRFGGISSGVSRSKSKEINSFPEANASQNTKHIREEEEKKEPPNPQGGTGRRAKSRGFIEPDLTVSENFVEFWQAYPRKTAKQHAKTVFDRYRPADQRALIAAARKFAAQMLTEKRPPEKIPYPATWLNPETGGFADFMKDVPRGADGRSPEQRHDAAPEAESGRAGDVDDLFRGGPADGGGGHGDAECAGAGGRGGAHGLAGLSGVDRWRTERAASAHLARAGGDEHAGRDMGHAMPSPQRDDGRSGGRPARWVH